MFPVVLAEVVATWRAFSGVIGDGKIFLYKLDDAVRIRNRERGLAAI